MEHTVIQEIIDITNTIEDITRNVNWYRYYGRIIKKILK